jgi:hypothetical protein
VIVTATATGPTANPPGSRIVACSLVALAIVGHLCALLLVDVKPYAMYQHYLPWRLIPVERPLAASGILIQLAIVTVMAWRSREWLLLTFAPLLSARLLFVLAVAAGLSLAVPTENVPRVAGEIVLAGLLTLIAVLNLALAVLYLPAGLLVRSVAWIDSRITLRHHSPTVRQWDPYLPAAVAVWVAMLSALASYFVLERLPHIEDGISYLFQAKYFAKGLLYAPAPPDVESFRLDLIIIRDAKWFGYGFPGWPALLAVGAVAGVPWLINPLLGGTLVFLGHVWLRRHFDRAIANIAVLLLAASSWLIFTSAEFMPQPVTAVLVMVALIAFDRAIGNVGRWFVWSSLAGAAIGALFLTRSYDGMLTAVAVSLIAFRNFRSFQAWRALVTAGVVAVVIAAVILPYNHAITGRALYPPHLLWADTHYGPGVDVIGFGPNVGIRNWPNLDPLPGHGPADVVLNLNKNLFMVNIDLFGWPAGSLLFLCVAAAYGRRHDAILFLIPAVYAIGYSAFWFSGGPDLGARYWYPMLVPLSALTARGVMIVVDRLRATCGSLHAAGRTGAFLLVSLFSAAVIMLPWRAVTKHYRYRGITGEVRRLADTHHFGRAVVFVRGDEGRRDYQAAFNLNTPTLDAGTIYAFDAGPAHRATVLKHFPDRSVWVIGRDPLAVDGPALRVIAGPIPPGTDPR